MYLAVDIGGTKTLVAAIKDDGTIGEKIKIPTPQSYHEFIKECKAAFAKLPEGPYHYGGIGMPGLVDREKGVSTWTGGNLDWGQCPIAEDVGEIAGCKVVIENDANMAGLSEANLVLDQYKTALYLTISTGIGGVHVVDGKIDMSTADAEVGHMIYKVGEAYETWEQITSGKAIVDKYGQRAEEISEPGIWRDISEQLAVGLINLSAVLTPEVIIIGGGVGANLDRFHDYLNDAIQELRPAAITVPPVIQAQHAEEAVLYGCYELARQRHGKAD